MNTAYLFIKDVLSSQRTGNDFVHKSVTFKNIEFCGTITHLESVQNPDNSEFFIYTVDDGTGCIRCVIPVVASSEDFGGFTPAETNFFAKLRSKNSRSFKSPQNQTIQLCALAFDNLKRFDYRALQVGDEVRFGGTIKEEKTLKYVLVEKVEKIAKITQKIDYFNELFDFYKLTERCFSLHDGAEQRLPQRDHHSV